MNERDLEARLRRTYRTEAARTDPGAIAERVHSIPATVEPERRRWWHGFRSDATRRTGLGGTQVRGASNMFTAARMAAIVAVLALASSFLAVQVGSPPEGAPSAAAPEEEPFAATHVTGTLSAGTSSGGNVTRKVATFTHSDDFPHHTGYGGVYRREMTWSDPRLPSQMLLSENWDFYGVAGSDEFNGAISLVQNIRLEGSDGAWTGTAYGLLEETKPAERYPQTVLMVLEGEGAYEGLSAMLRTSYDDPPGFGTVPDWEGYIFEGGMTPLPEAPEPLAT